MVNVVTTAMTDVLIENRDKLALFVHSDKSSLDSNLSDPTGVVGVI